MNTEATEYSKSGTDDEGARQEEAAFDPNITDPQEQKEKAGEGTGVSPNCLNIDRSSLGHCAEFWSNRAVVDEYGATKQIQHSMSIGFFVRNIC